MPLLKGRIGVVHLGISDGPLRKGVNEIIRLIMYIIAAVLVFGSIAAVIFSAAITKPLFELLKGVRALGSGNLDARTSVVGEDEIGQLGRAFNDMVGKRRQAEEELRLSEEKFSDITSSLGEGVLVFDESGKLSFINPEAEQLLGWSAEELSGKNIHDVVHYKRSDGTHLAAEDCPNIRMLEAKGSLTMMMRISGRTERCCLCLIYLPRFSSRGRFRLRLLRSAILQTASR